MLRRTLRLRATVPAPAPDLKVIKEMAVRLVQLYETHLHRHRSEDGPVMVVPVEWDRVDCEGANFDWIVNNGLRLPNVRFAFYRRDSPCGPGKVKTAAPDL